MVNKFSSIIDEDLQEGAGVMDVLRESVPFIGRTIKSLIKRHGPQAVDWLSSRAKQKLEGWGEGGSFYPVGSGYQYRVATKKLYTRKYVPNKRRSGRSKSRSRSRSRSKSRGKSRSRSRSTSRRKSSSKKRTYKPRAPRKSSLKKDPSSVGAGIVRF
jgi:hypothetical protein